MKSPLKGKQFTRQSSHQSNGESSPKIPKLSPKIFKEKLEFGDPPKVEEVTQRRMTRRSLHDQESLKKECPKSPIVLVDVLSGSDDNEREERRSETTRRRGHKRNRKFSETVTLESSYKNDVAVVLEPVENGTSKPKVDRPPPLLIPSAISSKPSEGSGNESKGSSVDGDPSSVAYQEDVVDRIMAWQLLPSDMTQISPNSPSLLYGAQHLLRLFGECRCLS